MLNNRKKNSSHTWNTGVKHQHFSIISTISKKLLHTAKPGLHCRVQANSSALQLCMRTTKKSKRFSHQYVYTASILTHLILECHLAAFRETTFLDVLKPTLTPRHPTAGKAHAMDTRACLAPSHPCSEERTFQGQGHRCRVMKPNSQNVLEGSSLGIIQSCSVSVCNSLQLKP